MEGTIMTQLPTQVRFSADATRYGNAYAQVEPQRSAHMGKFVLVIDQSLTVQKVIEMMLLREGYRIRSFGNGIEAMRWFAKPEASIPDLMLVEFELPKMDGCEVIQKFKTKTRFASTACILLSRREQMPESFKSPGAVLRKPFTAQELVGVVHRSLDRIHA